jgi:hypothetical protein
MLEGVRAEVISCPDFVVSEKGSTLQFIEENFELAVILVILFSRYV